MVSQLTFLLLLVSLTLSVCGRNASQPVSEQAHQDTDGDSVHASDKLAQQPAQHLGEDHPDEELGIFSVMRLASRVDLSFASRGTGGETDRDRQDVPPDPVFMELYGESGTAETDLIDTDITNEDKDVKKDDNNDNKKLGNVEDKRKTTQRSDGPHSLSLKQEEADDGSAEYTTVNRAGRRLLFLWGYGKIVISCLSLSC